MKRFIYIVSIFFALLSAPDARAQSFDNEQQLRMFATCAGRLSAVMEHQWLFDGEASEITKRQRTAVIDLVKAVMPADRGREVLHWRISAKLAQSALLTRATFNDDAADAAWARSQADALAGRCTGLLLS